MTLAKNSRKKPMPKKSMLEDAEAFRSYQEAWMQANKKQAVIF